MGPDHRKPDEQRTGKEAPEENPPRTEEARRLIEEYANDLRKNCQETQSSPELRPPQLAASFVRCPSPRLQEARW
jgi:hypothetical protein